jgi:hypothetical protein
LLIDLSVNPSFEDSPEARCGNGGNVKQEIHTNNKKVGFLMKNIMSISFSNGRLSSEVS